MTWRTLIAATIVLAIAQSADAQPPQIGGAQRPAFSPYLNIVRPGGGPALNYYGLVRPEVQARQAIQNLQGTVGANQEAIGDLQSGQTDLPGTGHQANFMTHGSYFLTGGAPQAGGGPGRPPGQTTFTGGLNRPTPRR